MIRFGLAVVATLVVVVVAALGVVAVVVVALARGRPTTAVVPAASRDRAAVITRVRCRDIPFRFCEEEGLRMERFQRF
jgi:hypothetical protein